VEVNNTWSDMVLASLYGARRRLADDANDLTAHLNRGDALLTASNVLRLRYPDDPARALACLAAAERALERAASCARDLSSMTPFEVRCLLVLVLLHRARLTENAELVAEVHRQLSVMIDPLEELFLVSAGAELADVLAQAYMIDGMAYAGTVLGYPVEPELERARTRMRLAVHVLSDYQAGDHPPQTLMGVYVGRALLEARIGWPSGVKKYAEAALRVAHGVGSEVPAAIARTLLEGGDGNTVDRMMVASYSSLPDDIYEDL
jgi:hypothetical protein